MRALSLTKEEVLLGSDLFGLVIPQFRLKYTQPSRCPLEQSVTVVMTQRLTLTEHLLYARH